MIGIRRSEKDGPGRWHKIRVKVDAPSPPPAPRVDARRNDLSLGCFLLWHVSTLFISRLLRPSRAVWSQAPVLPEDLLRLRSVIEPFSARDGIHG
jgi:hypothetical protein